MSEEIKKVPMGSTGFVRDDKQGVGRFDLLPWRAIWEVAKHCENGARRYGERNIDKGCPQHSLIDSAFRHLAKYTFGMKDEEHLRACAWNILWALEQEVCRPEMQDIPARLTTRCVETTCYHNRDCICLAGKSQPESADACPLYSED